jgi:hypothetical protein
MAVLKAQEDGDDLKSTHAYFAASESGNIYTLHQSAAVHDGIRDAFAFTGYGGEHRSGLALAILYPHAELTADGILAAAIENFAPAIINGSVSLRVDGRVLDAASIDQIAVEIAENLNDDAIKSSVSRYLRLVRVGLDKTGAHTIRLPNALKGDLDAVRGKPETKTLLKKIASDEDVCLNIVFPLAKNGTSTDVSVQVVLGPTTQGCRPLDRLFRRGMSLPDVRAKNPGELDMVMLVGDGLLSTYLKAKDMAEAILASIKNLSLYDLLPRTGLWAWLTFVLRDQLFSKSPDGTLKVGEVHRWYPSNPNDWQKGQRHLVRMPVLLLKSLGSSADHLLCGLPSILPEIREQLTSQQDMFNAAFQQVARTLYFDNATGMLKRGAGGKSGGTPRRLATLRKQLDVTWDLEDLDPSDIVSRLPKEFGRFLPKATAEKPPGHMRAG